MTFYNNRISIANVNEKEIYLIAKIKNELILNYYSTKGDILESIIADDLLDEFDILINHDLVYLIYQDMNLNLNLLILEGENKDIHKLTSVDFPKIFELNIINHEDDLNIFFLYPINNSNNLYQIEHNILKDDKWESYLVEQVKISQVLNPIKVISVGKSMFLAYYYENQIFLKSYNKIDKWNEPVVLTDNGEKLYLDIIYDEGYFHLVYSEAIDGNYMIKYKKYKDGTVLIQEHEAEMSRKTNTTNPTILNRNGALWIIWNESSRIYSRYSKDKGKTWSDIVSWEESIKQNIFRFKYISNSDHKGDIIDYTFGTIHPEIKFIGFY